MAKPIEADVVLSCGEHLPAVDVWMVIDVLRATTVITRWFELGGGDLFPVGSVEAARRLARTLANEGAAPLLMGEENGIPPQGFDLGNSPLDLTRDLIREHPHAVMATTNGTGALLSAAATGVPVVVACARNAAAALDCALSLGSRIGILCAGRKRRPAWDDTICAGVILDELTRRAPDLLLADSARLALLTWRTSGGKLLSSVQTADHAVFLNKIGYGPDVSFACEVDAASVAPVLHEEPQEGEMRAVLRNARDVPRPAPELSPPPSAAAAPKPLQGPDPFQDLLRYAQGENEAPRYFFLGGARRAVGKKMDMALKEEERR